MYSCPLFIAHPDAAVGEITIGNGKCVCVSLSHTHTRTTKGLKVVPDEKKKSMSCERVNKRWMSSRKFDGHHQHPWLSLNPAGKSAAASGLASMKKEFVAIAANEQKENVQIQSSTTRDDSPRLNFPVETRETSLLQTAFDVT